MLLDDWRASINDQLHQAADEAISRARAAQTATIAPIQQAAQQLPQIQTPDPGQVGAALHSYVDQLGQQAGPAVIQVGQNAADAAQQVGTQVLGGAQQAQAGIGDALHQHVDNLVQLGGGNAVQQLGQPPVLGGSSNANRPVVTTITPPQAAQADVLGGPPSADTSLSNTQVQAPSSNGPSGSIPANYNVPINKGPTISRAQAEAVVKGTPLEGIGGTIWDMGVKYNVDPAFALSVAKNESAYGDPNVAPMQNQSNNIWDISGGAYGGTPGGRWGHYATKEAGAEAFYKLITTEYYPKAQDTVGSVMWGPQGSQQHAYAPLSENSSQYPQRLIDTMGNYRQLPGGSTGPSSAPSAPVTTAQARAADLGYGDQALPHNEEPGTATDHLNDKWKTQFDFGAVYTGDYRTGTPHRGVDLVPSNGKGIGTEVDAFVPGTVTNVFRDPGGAGGLIVYVQDATGLTHAYMHLLSANVKVGDQVSRGTPIAQMGESGTEGSPHLHYEVRANASNGDPLDKLIDPRPYVKGEAGQTNAATAPGAAGAAPATLGGTTGTTPGAVNVQDQQQKQPPPIIMGGLQDAAGAVGDTLGAAGRAVGGAASALGSAAQGAVQGAQQLNQQTPGQVVVNQVTPVLGGAASDLGSNVRRVADQAVPVLGEAGATAADLATGGITRRFNENLRGLGQDVLGATPTVDLSQGAKPILGAAAAGLETTAKNLPADAPALAGILDFTAAQLRQPGVLDAIQTRQELNNKYANTPGATTIRDANGQPIVLSVDSSHMTPEDKAQYDQTGFVIGSISGPVEREGGLPTRGEPRATRVTQVPTVDELAARLETQDGRPGVSIEPYHAGTLGNQPDFGKNVVYRDADGKVQGVLQMLLDEHGQPDSLSVAVNPERQRQGIATALYDAAKAAGYDVERASGQSGYTEAGAALARARQAGEPPTPRGVGEAPDLRKSGDEPIRTLPGGGDTSLQRELPGMPAEADTAARARQGVDNPVDMRRSQQVGRLVNTLGEDIGPNDMVTVYHATTPEVAASLVENGFQPGAKQARDVTTVKDPSVARMLGKNVGDALDYEPGRGQGQGVYFTTDPRAARDVYGSSIVAIDVPRSALEIPPERQTARMTPERALLLGDGYTTQPISPDQVRLVNTGGVPLERPAADVRGTSGVPGVGGGTPPPETGFRAPVTPDDLNVRQISQQQARELVGPAYDPSTRTTARPPEEGEGPAGREPPYTPPVQNLSEVHSNPHLLNEARPGETPMTPDERMTYAEDLESRRQANQDRLDAIDEQLRNPNAKPVRPPWGAGWTNDQLTAIARAHGESAYAPLWWERAGLDVGSGEVRENVGQGGFKNPNAARDATPAELRAERNQLGAEQRDLQAAIDQQTAAPDNASFVRRQQTRGELPFENGAQGVNGPHATEQHNDTPGGVAADMVTRNGTKDYGNPLRDGPGQVIGTAERGGRDVTGRGITDVEAAGIGEPSAKTKFLMPNLDAMLGEEMPEVRAQIQKAAEDNQELMAAYQQGRISHDSVVTDLANRVGMSKKDWLKTKVGQGFSTPELAALQAAAIDAEGQSKKLAQDIGARENGVDGLTPEEVAHSLETFVDNAHLLAVARGGRASAGRSLNILKKKLTATLAQGINASNERIAATKAKAQAQAAVKRATKQLEDSKNLDEEKRTVVNGLKNGEVPAATAAASRPNQAGAPRAPKNIIDQIADAYDQLDRYNALSLHEKADVQAKLDAQRAANAAKRQAATREPPQELLAALKKELQWEQNNFAKRKDTWETMAFWDSKANEKVAMKRNAFRGGLYIEQYRKAAELAAKKAESDATRAWDLESRRQSVQSSKASALLESIGGEKPSRELLKNYIEAINNPDPMVAAKFIKGLQDPGWWGKSQILRIAGLLSSTATHAVNTTGNTTQMPLTMAEHALVVPIDAVRAAITGGERQAYRAELLPMVQAYGPGWFSALPRALEILKTGVSPQEAANIAQGKLGRPGFASGSGKFDATIEMPLRALQAEDELFRGGAFAMQSQRVATNYAYGEGFRGKQLVGRANDIIANLESYPELYTQAQKATDRMLFQEKRTMPLSDRIPTKGVPGAIVQGGIGQVLPFIKTPGNITAQGFGLSPFGGAGVLEAVANRRNLRPEQLGQQTLLAEQRLARTALGTMIFGGFTAMGLGAFTAGKSMLTGAYDPDEASTYPQGYREWSQVVEDPVSGNTYYVPFQNFGAAGVPMAMAAIATDAYRHGKDFFSGDEAIRAGTAIGQYMMDNTFLQGLSDTVNVFHDPTRYGPTAVQGLISSYGPYSAMGRQVQRAMGVASRNPREGFHGLLDAMAANYPGTSSTVPEATTALGEPRTQGISGAASFTLPFRADISRDEPTLSVLRANDIQIPAAPKSLNVVGGSIELSEEEQDQVKRARGEAIKLGVAAVAKSAAYQRADVGLRNEMLKRELTFDTQRANGEFLKQLTREQILARRQAKAVPEPYYLAGADNG